MWKCPATNISLRHFCCKVQISIVQAFLSDWRQKQSLATTFMLIFAISTSTHNRVRFKKQETACSPTQKRNPGFGWPYTTWSETNPAGPVKWDRGLHLARCMGVRRGSRECHAPRGYWNFIFPYYLFSRKMLYLSFELVKLNFTTVAPLEKSFWPPHGKIQYFPPLWKNIFDAHGLRTTYWTTCINQSQCRVLLQCKNRDIIKLQI